MQRTQGAIRLLAKLVEHQEHIARGKKQRVPRPVADLIRQRMRTEREARKFNEEQARKMSDPALQG